MAEYTIPGLPRSLNHQYIRRGKFWDIEPAQKQFRDAVYFVARDRQWEPKGVTAAVILFYGPDWVTKERTIRQTDVDNRIKAVLDGHERATSASDADNWLVFGMKVLCNQSFTRLYLFDMGDVVPYCQIGSLPSKPLSW